jgi:hypothetical protein
LKDQWVIKETRKEIKKFLDLNENDTTYQDLWDIAKAILKGMFIAMRAHLGKLEKS